MLRIVKVAKHKSGWFEHAIRMFKWPTGFIYIGNIIYYLAYLPTPCPRGLEVDLEGSSTFSMPILSIHIDRLGLFCYF